MLAVVFPTRTDVENAMRPKVTAAMPANQNSGFSGLIGDAAAAAPACGVGTACSCVSARLPAGDVTRYLSDDVGAQVVDTFDHAPAWNMVSCTYSTRLAARLTSFCTVIPSRNSLVVPRSTTSRNTFSDAKSWQNAPHRPRSAL